MQNILAQEDKFWLYPTMGRVIVLIISIVIATIGVFLINLCKQPPSSKEVVLPSSNKDILLSPTTNRIITTLDQEEDKFISYDGRNVPINALADLARFINGHVESKTTEMCEAFLMPNCVPSTSRYDASNDPIWDERFYNAQIIQVKVNGKKSKGLLMLKLSQRISRYKESYRYFFFKKWSQGYLREV
ncbi:MAG: hypothetical protein AB1489_33410, partial [Acidobacteriota bacterium]